MTYFSTSTVSPFAMKLLGTKPSLPETKDLAFHQSPFLEKKCNKNAQFWNTENTDMGNFIQSINGCNVCTITVCFHSSCIYCWCNCCNLFCFCEYSQSAQFCYILSIKSGYICGIKSSSLFWNILRERLFSSPLDRVTYKQHCKQQFVKFITQDRSFLM